MMSGVCCGGGGGGGGEVVVVEVGLGVGGHGRGEFESSWVCEGMMWSACLMAAVSRGKKMSSLRGADCVGF